MQSSEPEWQPLIIGTIDAPRERAILLAEALRATGYDGKSICQSDLEVFHRILCEGRGWAPVSWLAICRELILAAIEAIAAHGDECSAR